MTKVLKFGGTSVGSVESINEVKKIIQKEFKKNGSQAFVVSAFSGVTNALLDLGLQASKNKIDFQNNNSEFSKLKQTHLDFAAKLCKDSYFREAEDFVEARFLELSQILNLINEGRDFSDKFSDQVSSFGEMLSSFIISRSLLSDGLNSDFLDSRRVIKTDSNFTKAKVDFQETNKLIKEFFQQNPSKIFVVAGFISSDKNGETTTLGRGGSDFSGAIFGAALKVDEIEIWTDVDGVLTADPRKVNGAKSIPNLTYEEALELSHFGAKVIYPPSVLPAFENQIPLRIKNTFNSGHVGTVISNVNLDAATIKNGQGNAKRYDRILNQVQDDNGVVQEGNSVFQEDSKVHEVWKYDAKCVTTVSDLCLVTIQGSGIIGVEGSAARIFGVLSKNKINVVLISQASSEYSISLAVENKKSTLAKNVIEKEFAKEIQKGYLDPLNLRCNACVISVVGKNMREKPGTAAKFFGALAKADVNIKAIAQGANELNISAVVSEDNKIKALQAVHQEIFENSTLFESSKNSKDLPSKIFLAGVGTIGSELISQLLNQKEELAEKNQNYILAGVARSKSFALKNEGFETEENLKLEMKNGNISEFIERILEDSGNRIFVDCTTSNQVSDYYKTLLENGIDVVTANKKAASEDYQKFQNILQTSEKTGAKFKFETNVGAGLPIIQTLQNLVLSGDEILKIEGILSGTLSYLFNNWDESMRFSELVKKAKELGYTEPDPREDLNGLDVARKILILGRLAASSKNLEDLDIQSLVPKDCEGDMKTEEFFEKLAKHDQEFAWKRDSANKEGKKLRYVAKFEEGKISVGLQEVHSSHPFYGLKGSDNIISITTKRYPNPMVIQGSGAGAGVTAAGLFGDILACL